MKYVVADVALMRELMRFRGYTQVSLAEVLGVRVATVNRIINGKSVPTLALALEIAERLGVAVEELWRVNEVKSRP